MILFIFSIFNKFLIALKKPTLFLREIKGLISLNRESFLKDQTEIKFSFDNISDDTSVALENPFRLQKHRHWLSAGTLQILAIVPVTNEHVLKHSITLIKSSCFEAKYLCFHSNTTNHQPSCLKQVA